MKAPKGTISVMFESTGVTPDLQLRDEIVSLGTNCLGKYQNSGIQLGTDKRPDVMHVYVDFFFDSDVLTTVFKMALQSRFKDRVSVENA